MKFITLFHARLDRVAVFSADRAKRRTERCPRNLDGLLWLAGKIERHLAGEERIGLRVVHEQDGRFISWVAAFDLDDHDQTRDRLPDALRLVEVLERYGFRLNESVLNERSKTGGGVHLWLFFEEPFEVQAWRLKAALLLEAAGLDPKTEIFPAGGRRGGTFPWLPYFARAEAPRTGKGAFLAPLTGRVIPLAEFLNRARPAPAETFEKLPEPPKALSRGRGGPGGKPSRRGCIKPLSFPPPPRIKRMMERGLWKAPARMPRGPFPPGERNQPRVLAALALARGGKALADFREWNDTHCGPCPDGELEAIWGWAWRERKEATHAVPEH